MNWYNGDIGTAISTSKTSQLIFMVYAYDEEEANHQMHDLINSDEDVAKLLNDNCLSLKLVKENETCKQFTQIYPVKSYPTIYLIGNNGRPLDVIPGKGDQAVESKETLLASLQKSVVAHTLSLQIATVAAVAATASTSGSTSAAASLDQEQPKSSSEESSVAAEVVGAADSIEEKVALAKEKLRQIQAKKLADEKEKQRIAEVNRRKMGQEVIKQKRERDEQEMRRVAAEKRKEKLDDELAKQRVKERIAQDREEKNKKYSVEQQEAAAAKKLRQGQQAAKIAEEKTAEAARNSASARLQFKFTDGSSIQNRFEPTDNLEVARAFVEQKNESSSFTLHSVFPKKEFKAEDMEKTLRDLQLAPSATILVIPVRSKTTKAFKFIIPSTSAASSSASSGSSNSGGSTNNSGTMMSYVTDLFSLMFLPLNIIWNVIGGLLGINGNGNRVSGTEAPPPRISANSRGAPPTSQDSNLRQRRSNLGGPSNPEQDDKDKEKKTTYNGNSTQQL